MITLWDRTKLHDAGEDEARQGDLGLSAARQEIAELQQTLEDKNSECMNLTTEEDAAEVAQVMVRMTDGTTVTVKLWAEGTIDAVRYWVASLCNTTPDKIHLFHNAHFLRDGMTVGRCGIVTGDVVRVTPRQLQRRDGAIASEKNKNSSPRRRSGQQPTQPSTPPPAHLLPGGAPTPKPVPTPKSMPACKRQRQSSSRQWH